MRLSLTDCSQTARELIQKANKAGQSAITLAKNSNKIALAEKLTAACSAQTLPQPNSTILAASTNISENLTGIIIVPTEQDKQQIIKATSCNSKAAQLSAPWHWPWQEIPSPYRNDQPAIP